MLSESRKDYETCYLQQVYAPLYAAPWWLDATCGAGQWHSIKVAQTNHDAQIRFPVYVTKIRGLRSVISPPLTQWVPVMATHLAGPLSLQEVLTSLPAYPILDLTFKQSPDLFPPEHPYHSRVRYSYIIPPATDVAIVRKRYNEGLRRNLKEADSLYRIETSDDISTFLLLCQSSYHQRGMKEPVWFSTILPSALQELNRRQLGKLQMAYEKGKAIAGIITGWDEKVMYYLAGGRSDTASAASAHALLLDHAIMEAQEGKREFDFEGSMHPGIANFFQSFGATPDPYWHIQKYNGIGKIWSLFQ